MTATVYMANTISARWNEMSLTFNLAMLVMLLCVAVMYFIQTRLKEQDTGAAVIIGAVIMVIGRDNMNTFLIGTLIAAFGNFGMLMFKHKKGAFQ